MKNKKHLLKPATALLLACLLLVCAALPCFAAGDTETFTPVLRFIASSDSHVRTENDKTFERIGRMLAQAYALSDGDETYQNLDALVMAGDMRNGTTHSFWASSPRTTTAGT